MWAALMASLIVLDCSAPDASGAVMWWASPTVEYPKISAKIVEPRAKARFNSSKTKIPAPSPKVIPILLASKGLQGV